MGEKEKKKRRDAVVKKRERKRAIPTIHPSPGKGELITKKGKEV